MGKGLTNLHGLPEPVYRAICNDDYTPGDADYTTTQLIKPVRIVALSRKYGGKTSEDAIDRLWSLWGQLLHLLFERAAMGDELTEKRLYAVVDGFRVGGRFDLLHGTILTDYKETKVLRTNRPKEDWVQQGNINRFLCEQNGFPITSIEYWARYRDWDLITSTHDSSYPPPMQKFDIPMWPLEQTRQFIRARIADHEAGRDDPPLCSPEERWESPERFAHMRKGQKRAVRLYGTEQEAQEAATGPDDRVEHRPGVPKRCLYYCPVTAHCAFGREAIAKHAGLEP